MKKVWITIVVVLIIIFGFWVSEIVFKKELPKEKNSSVAMEEQTYWTCPMHPQVHADHAGECPICHMKLVQVKAQQSQSTEQNQGDKRATIHATSEQSVLLGIQRTEVEKMNLKFKIPVSGRFISSSTVAFQVYESDLRYIKPGLSFYGANSFYPEEEVVGYISSIDAIVDPTSRTVRVVGSVKKGMRGARSETGFRGNIEMVLKDRIAIPESSVLHTGENDIIYVFSNGNQLKPVVVKLGLKTEGFYDVLAGIDSGQVISSGPNFLIDSESKIRGASMSSDGSIKSSKPTCPNGQHWDTPMAMCMPGKD